MLSVGSKSFVPVTVQSMNQNTKLSVYNIQPSFSTQEYCLSSPIQIKRENETDI